MDTSSTEALVHTAKYTQQQEAWCVLALHRIHPAPKVGFAVQGEVYAAPEYW